MIRFTVLFLAAWCVCVTGVADDAVSNPQVRVLTYNIHHGRGMDGKFDYQRLANIIIKLKPDVVALQEVDCKTRRSSGVDQAAKLGELTGMRHAFGNAMYHAGGQYGEAILSRYPISEIRTYPLPFRPGFESRAAIAAHITPDNGVPKFTFVGSHFCHQSQDVRTEQAQQINFLFTKQSGIPVIFSGDLNARTGSPPMKVLLTEKWVDAVAPKSRIDFVLYRKCDPWKVVDVQILDEPIASDHQPVLVVLEWTGVAE